MQLLRSGVFNLLKWRPFFLDAAVQAFLRPSGVIPGAEIGRRAQWWFSAGGDGEDDGLDGVSASLFRVLSARNLDQVVLPFYFEVLSVICNVTTDDEYSSIWVLRDLSRSKKKLYLSSCVFFLFLI